MARGIVLTVMLACLIAVAGCTTVQKGSAVGAAAGGAAGAGVGHYMSSMGGGPGAAIGLGVGAATGAIAAEYYYGSDEGEDLAAAQETVDRLSDELQQKDAQLSDVAVTLEKEKAQQKALLEAYNKARQEHKTLAANVPANVQVVSDGDTVTFTILSEVLFDSGATELTKEGKAALREAAQAIRRDFPGALVEVRGHTDNVPIRYSPFKSNWELSCTRALAVLHYLIESEGFKPEHLTAVGCADTRPVGPNATPKGRSKNRRAEIVVRPNGVRVAQLTLAR